MVPVFWVIFLVLYVDMIPNTCITSWRSINKRVKLQTNAFLAPAGNG